ncbi:hypothetical protein ACOME3_001885 [Neoechinorhynchus agilis]
MQLICFNDLDTQGILNNDEDDIGVVIETDRLTASERSFIRMGEKSKEHETPRRGHVTDLPISAGKTIPLSRLQDYLTKVSSSKVEYVYGADTVAQSIRSSAIASAAMTPRVNLESAPWGTPAVEEQRRNDTPPPISDIESEDSDLSVERRPQRLPRRNCRRSRKVEVEEDEDEEIRRRYEIWSKGIVQVREEEQKKRDVERSADQPLARLPDDQELDSYLKGQIRAGDPMMKFIAQESSCVKPKTITRCPHPAPPNRYGIMPGYRWDGVDRSNGFETKYFAEKAKKAAIAEHAYKWRVEDM